MGARPDEPALSAPSRRREAWLAVLAALLLAAWPVRAALLDPGEVLFAVDTATSQLPWSAAEGGGTSVANPDLADHGTQFYPFYRWVAKSWLAGDPPTWCPLIYAGAPGFGNAQSGALDPQVGLLVLFEALGGRALFDWGLSFVAWLRFACALLGAYCLARRLGLAPAPAALTGVTYGFCGFLVLWLNHALGHVPPFLPWMLFFLEGLRGGRPLLSMTGTAAALALAILGGHVETAFYVGLAGGVWCLAIAAKERRAGLLGLAGLGLGTLAAAALLLPTYEYLDLSAAKYIRELGATEARAAVDLLALGVVVVLVGLVVTFVRLDRSGASRDRDERSAGSWLPGALGLGLAFGGAALFLAGRGLSTGSVLALVSRLLRQARRAGRLSRRGQLHRDGERLDPLRRAGTLPGGRPHAPRRSAPTPPGHGTRRRRLPALDPPTGAARGLSLRAVRRAGGDRALRARGRPHAGAARR